MPYNRNTQYSYLEKPKRRSVLGFLFRSMMVTLALFGLTFLIFITLFYPEMKENMSQIINICTIAVVQKANENSQGELAQFIQKSQDKSPKGIARHIAQNPVEFFSFFDFKDTQNNQNEQMNKQINPSEGLENITIREIKTQEQK